LPFSTGFKGALRPFEDQLLFILVYQKTYPLQAPHGLQFGLSQPQAHDWIYRLLPVLKCALADLAMTPQREGEQVATSALVNESAPDLLIDGTERRRCRPRTKTNGSLPTVARTKRLLECLSSTYSMICLIGRFISKCRSDWLAIPLIHLIYDHIEREIVA
jgi:hypothetical protein